MTIEVSIHHSFALLLLAMALGLGCNTPQDSSDAGEDTGGDTGKAIPMYCYQYTERSECEAAGCNFFEGSSPRICIDELGQCVRGDISEGACGYIDAQDHFVANLAITHYTETESGERIVRWFSIPAPELEDWTTCLVYESEGPVREGAPPECECDPAEAMPGKCPEVE